MTFKTNKAKKIKNQYYMSIKLFNTNIYNNDLVDVITLWHQYWKDYI